MWNRECRCGTGSEVYRQELGIREGGLGVKGMAPGVREMDNATHANIAFDLLFNLIRIRLNSFDLD